MAQPFTFRGLVNSIFKSPNNYKPATRLRFLRKTTMLPSCCDMKIINVEVRVISRGKGKDDNSYRDIDNLAYHKNRIH